uniref:Cullin-5 n=1 Tax=Panagrellus redivivus TaxID=6233 RepID=A0A7E4ZYY5_PANRE
MLLQDPFGAGGATFDSEWRVGLRIIKHLLNRQNVTQQEWQELFVIMNRLTTWLDNGCELVGAELSNELSIHVSQAAKTLPVNSDDQTLLNAYIDQWNVYMVMVQHLPMPFNFLSRRYSSPAVLPTSASAFAIHTKGVRQTMLATWNRIIFNNIKGRLLKATLDLIEKERLNEMVEQSKIVGIRDSYIELNTNDMDRLDLYTREFEAAYLDATATFYRARAADMLEKNGILSYIAYADSKLQEEQQRAEKYLDKSDGRSVNALVAKCVEILVSDHEDQMHNECTSLITANDVERLQMIYRLTNKTPNGINTMLKKLFEFVRQEGLNQMLQNAQTIVSNSDKYVDHLLDMHERFTKLIGDAFYNDPRFLTERDKAFQDVVNSTEVFKMDTTKALKGAVESRSPELLAVYCDQLLRKTAMSKRLSSEEVDEKLNRVLLVLKYVQSKDIFMRFHKQHMSRRLVLETTADQEKEETLVRRFREIGMPADYVNKLSRMLQDVEVNKDTNVEIKRSIAANNNDALPIIDILTLKVLNVGAWGKPRRSHVSLPREIEDCAGEIEEAYKKMHCGRKLFWSPQMSSAVIVWNNKHGKYDFEVSSMQLSVLHCFNDRPTEKLTYDSLRLATELVEQDLNRTLMSLVSMPRVQMQLVHTDCVPLNPKNFNDSTLFWINQDFALVKNDKIQPRGKISFIGRLNVGGDANNENECDEVMKLREFRTQEAIVKVMKTRKQVTSAQLQTSLIELLKDMFCPSKRLIKEQIEWLIENNYIKRDPKDMNTFIYVT